MTVDQEEQVKSREEIMEILEAFDLTKSFRDAGELAGCSHHTVAHWVTWRDAGKLPGEGRSAVSASSTRSWPRSRSGWSAATPRCANVCFDKLMALGFAGSERTVRRGVAEVKANHRRGRRRVYRPWIPEPGMWAQYSGVADTSR